jgi:hypothetical protein
MNKMNFKILRTRNHRPNFPIRQVDTTAKVTQHARTTSTAAFPFSQRRAHILLGWHGLRNRSERTLCWNGFTATQSHAKRHTIRGTRSLYEPIVCICSIIRSRGPLLAFFRVTGSRINSRGWGRKLPHAQIHLGLQSQGRRVSSTHNIQFFRFGTWCWLHMQKLRGAPLPTTEMRRLLFTQQALIPSDKICCTILVVRLHPEYGVDTSQS